MIRKYFFVFLLCFLAISSLGQRSNCPLTDYYKEKLDSILNVYAKERQVLYTGSTYKLTLYENKKWDFTKSRAYEDQGLYYSTYFILNHDSTFIFYSSFEVGSELSTGTWKAQSGHSITFNWDKAKTLDFCCDSSKYSIFFRYGPPFPLMIDNWNFEIRQNSLVPFKRKKRIK